MTFGYEKYNADVILIFGGCGFNGWELHHNIVSWICDVKGRGWKAADGNIYAFAGAGRTAPCCV